MIFFFIAVILCLFHMLRRAWAEIAYLQAHVKELQAVICQQKKAREELEARIGIRQRGDVP